MAAINSVFIPAPQKPSAPTLKSTVEGEGSKDQSGNGDGGAEMLFNPMLVQLLASQFPSPSAGIGVPAPLPTAPKGEVGGESGAETAQTANALQRQIPNVGTLTTGLLLGNSPAGSEPGRAMSTEGEQGSAPKPLPIAFPKETALEALLNGIHDPDLAQLQGKPGEEKVSVSRESHANDSMPRAEYSFANSTSGLDPGLANSAARLPRIPDTLIKPDPKVGSMLPTNGVDAKRAEFVAGNGMQQANLSDTVPQQSTTSDTGRTNPSTNGNSNFAVQIQMMADDGGRRSGTRTDVGEDQRQSKNAQGDIHLQTDSVAATTPQADNDYTPKGHTDAVKHQTMPVQMKEEFLRNPAEVLETKLAALSPKVVTSIRDQVIEGMSLKVLNNASEMRITLKPESLGEVVVSVRMDDAAMVARIDVNHQNVKAVLDANISQLHTVLVERGIQVDRIDILDSSSASSRQSDSRPPEKEKSSSKRRTDEPVESFDTIWQLGYNTLDYLI